ncbi:MAG: TAXI family TRAP transporter solute-binding subunit [Alphaproteobacteria bacterium]|nr:TAXI family TRAP transporter solute-binding subunit [Alphaproteobacteria bacterium]
MRSIIATAMTVLALTGITGGAAASETITFFRIATGGVGGTYYPVSGLIAQAISNPPGSRPCDKGGSCGVPGLVAVAQSAHGSVANIAAVAAGEVESAFAQSDTAYWAHTGTGIYLKSGKVEGIRAIAALYPESIHLVARKGSGIRSVLDLAGRRVSLDEEGSGTLVDARLILSAFGLKESDVKAAYRKPVPSIEMMEAGELDAFFIVAGYPASAVAELAEAVGAELVPIEGPEVDLLAEKYGFFTRVTIPAGTYKGVADIRTLSVGAQWIVGAGVDEELVYRITRSLWHDSTRALLQAGHPQARAIIRETALDGIAIPLHPGAERYYREAGMIR